MDYARTWNIRSTIIGIHIAHGNLLIAAKKPPAYLQFHRSQRRRRTCDWRSLHVTGVPVMSKMLFDVVWTGHFFEDLGHMGMSSQEIGVYFAAVWILIYHPRSWRMDDWQCLPSAGLWHRWRNGARCGWYLAKPNHTPQSLPLSLCSNLDEYPWVSLFTRPLSTCSDLSYFGTQRLRAYYWLAYDKIWGDMYSVETRMRVQCSTFLV